MSAAWSGNGASTIDRVTGERVTITEEQVAELAAQAAAPPAPPPPAATRRRPLNRAERLGLAAAFGQLQQADAQRQQAEQQLREVLADLGLDGLDLTRAYRVTPEGWLVEAAPVLADEAPVEPEA